MDIWPQMKATVNAQSDRKIILTTNKY